MNWLLEDSGVTATVKNISWERINLNLDVRVERKKSNIDMASLDFYAVNGLDRAKILFKKEILSADAIRLKANITNNGEQRCVPTGTYRIYICRQEDVLAECEADPGIADRMADFSRNFLYANYNKTFDVTFYIADDTETLPFRMHVLNAGRIGLDFPRNPSFRARFRPLKAIKNCFFSGRSVLRRLYKFFSHHYRNKRKNTVLFMTEQSDTIKSNLKAVSDRMIARGLDSEFKLLYSARMPSKKGRGKSSWIRLVKLMAQSETIFIDDHAPILDWLKLDKGTRLIQLWHAGAGFKSSGYSRWGNQGCPAPQSCHRQYRYGIAGSKNIAPFFSEVWGINDEQVLPTGMPRMDEYLDKDYRKRKTAELYHGFPLCRNKKVILFAPTYRGKNKVDAYYPYELINFEKLYQLCGDEYVVLFKMHPWVNEDIVIEEQYQDKFLDVKCYPNINDLFYIVDLLITDYSSNIFEYSLMRKPMLFFAYDKIQYAFSRGFHRPYEESAPGKVCYTFEEILNAIEQKDFEYEKVEQYIEHHFDYIDSHASDRVIDWILLKKMPREIKASIQKVKDENRRMNELDFSAGIETE